MSEESTETTEVETEEESSEETTTEESVSYEPHLRAYLVKQGVDPEELLKEDNWATKSNGELVFLGDVGNKEETKEEVKKTAPSKKSVGASKKTKEVELSPPDPTKDPEGYKKYYKTIMEA